MGIVEEGRYRTASLLCFVRGGGEGGGFFFSCRFNVVMIACRSSRVAAASVLISVRLRGELWCILLEESFGAGGGGRQAMEGICVFYLLWLRCIDCDAGVAVGRYVGWVGVAVVAVGFPSHPGAAVVARVRREGRVKPFSSFFLCFSFPSSRVRDK